MLLTRVGSRILFVLGPIASLQMPLAESTPDPFEIAVDRTVHVPLPRQIERGIADAIVNGRLQRGARLPSWNDLASQLGVARGTVRIAYRSLVESGLARTGGAAGTRVASELPAHVVRPPPPIESRIPSMINEVGKRPLVFQLGVPSQDAFPFKSWSRTMVRAARQAASRPVGYPDPRGLPQLRREVAVHLNIARGFDCEADRVFITNGFTGGLCLAIAALALAGKSVWTEDPGFPRTRRALAYAGVDGIAIPVDEQGLDVDAGVRIAPHAAAAIVTPGQQAPLGMVLSSRRRARLLQWACQAGAWVIEDDYLSELHLDGRPTACLAASDAAGRVIHVGSFSKTLSPTLRLGFVVVPRALATLFGDVSACLAPAGDPTGQQALADFIGGGHFLRHMRRMKQLYGARRDLLWRCLRERVATGTAVDAMGGLAVRLSLPPSVDDVALARSALSLGLGPVALSPWYAARPATPSLMLGITNLDIATLPADCDRLVQHIGRHAAPR